jgi:ATP-dependent DNA helicase RecQ
MDDTTRTLEAAREVMQRHWGYPSFRPGQGEIIEAVLDGRDVLGVLPTGGGKSLCYQIPAVLRDGFALVLSPLISLMHDQVAGLRAHGIEATFINSTLRYHEIDQRWTDAEHGRFDLVYMAPERLSNELFQARASRLNVSLLAVDEAHCVSEWGHHFRPDYRTIPDARALLDDPPTVAVTATATPDVRRDVIEGLDLSDPAEVVRGFDRPNIVWSVFRTDHKRGKVRDIVEAVPGSGIVYAATRRAVEQWTNWLQREGHAAAGYHGGMDADRRESVQDDWIDGTTRIIVATNAFGMGIDKPDVRFVIHVDLPSSLEAYYQEAGRAGRDGATAYAVLLFQPPDAETQEALIEMAHPSASEVRAVYDAACNAGQVPVGSEPDGPVVVDQEVIVKITGLSRGKVRTAIDLLERQDAWTVLPKRTRYGLIRFAQPASTVREYAASVDNRALGHFVRTLLRTVHADAFTDWWRIDLRLLERRTDLERDRLLRGLQYLADRDVIDWRPPGDALELDLGFPRAQKLPVDGRVVERARERAETRLQYMLRYARSVTCRRRAVLTYFGEASPERCGTCDVCLGRHRLDAVTPEDEPTLRAILQGIHDAAPRSEWIDDGSRPRYRVEQLVAWLVEQGYVETEDPLAGTYTVTEKAERFLDG